MSGHINLVRIRVVANLLAPLKQRIVFVGGATVSLYIDQFAPEARPTDDVDVVIELASYGEYAAAETLYPGSNGTAPGGKKG